VVPRLDGTLNMNRGDVGAGESAIVDDLFDAGTGRRNFRREIREASGPVADDRGETCEPAIGDQAALDHAAQNVRIDVAAAEKEHDAFRREFRKLTGKTSGERRCGRALNYAFLQLEDPQHRD